MEYSGRSYERVVFVVFGVYGRYVRSALSILFSYGVGVRKGGYSYLYLTCSASYLDVMFFLRYVRDNFVGVHVLFHFFIFPRRLYYFLCGVYCVRVMHVYGRVFIYYSNSIHALFFVRYGPISVLRSALPRSILFAVILSMICPLVRAFPIFFRGAFVAVRLVGGP